MGNNVDRRLLHATGLLPLVSTLKAQRVADEMSEKPGRIEKIATNIFMGGLGIVLGGIDLLFPATTIAVASDKKPAPPLIVAMAVVDIAFDYIVGSQIIDHAPHLAVPAALGGAITGGLLWAGKSIVNLAIDEAALRTIHARKD